jgi:hypothetical protein
VVNTCDEGEDDGENESAPVFVVRDLATFFGALFLIGTAADDGILVLEAEMVLLPGAEVPVKEPFRLRNFKLHLTCSKGRMKKEVSEKEK